MNRRETLKRAKQDPFFRKRIINHLLRTANSRGAGIVSFEELSKNQQWSAKFLASRFQCPLRDFEFFYQGTEVIVARFKSTKWEIIEHDFGLLKDAVSSLEGIGNNIILAALRF